MLLLAGCVGHGQDGEDGPPMAIAWPDVDVRAPDRVDAGSGGYEPSIVAGLDGTLVVTAHKNNITNEGAQVSSWLWISGDDGLTWKPLESPASTHTLLPGFEGDVAVDASGRLYFVDTYLTDNTLSRWSLADGEATWELSRPIQGTAGADDRPWLDAQGDGIVYYIGNMGAPPPLSLTVPRMVLSVSEDGGITFAPRAVFPASRFCTPSASPAGDQSVLVVCEMEDDTMVAHWSGDRGVKWDVQTLAPCEALCGAGYPAAAIDAEGTGYVAWLDGRISSGDPTRIMLARRSAEGEWNVTDVTPRDALVGMAWVASYVPGTVAIAYYAADVGTTGSARAWKVHALVGQESAGEWAWQELLVDPQPVKEGEGPPGDFLQVAAAREPCFHLAYQRDLGQGPTGPVAQVYHARTCIVPRA